MHTMSTATIYIAPFFFMAFGAALTLLVQKFLKMRKASKE